MLDLKAAKNETALQVPGQRVHLYPLAYIRTNQAMEGPIMKPEEAIEVIKKHYPDERYTQLRKALDFAIELLENEVNGE